MQQAEKDQIAKQLLSKEQELAHSQEEISRQNRRLTVERVLRRKTSTDEEDIESPFANYTYERVVTVIGADRVCDAPSGYLRARFDEVANDLPRAYIDDLERRGYFDSGLTLKGVKFLKAVAEKHRTK